MIDLDRFKNINDTYGHEAGDQFLKALGDLLLEQTRFGDVGPVALDADPCCRPS